MCACGAIGQRLEDCRVSSGAVRGLWLGTRRGEEPGKERGVGGKGRRLGNDRLQRDRDVGYVSGGLTYVVCSEDIEQDILTLEKEPEAAGSRAQCAYTSAPSHVVYALCLKAQTCHLHTASFMSSGRVVCQKWRRTIQAPPYTVTWNET